MHQRNCSATSVAVMSLSPAVELNSCVHHDQLVVDKSLMHKHWYSTTDVFHIVRLSSACHYHIIECIIWSASTDVKASSCIRLETAYVLCEGAYNEVSVHAAQMRICRQLEATWGLLSVTVFANFYLSPLQLKSHLQDLPRRIRKGKADQDCNCEFKVVKSGKA